LLAFGLIELIIIGILLLGAGWFLRLVFRFIETGWGLKLVALCLLAVGFGVWAWSGSQPSLDRVLPPSATPLTPEALPSAPGSLENPTIRETFHNGEPNSSVWFIPLEARVHGCYALTPGSLAVFPEGADAGMVPVLSTHGRRSFAGDWLVEMTLRPLALRGPGNFGLILQMVSDDGRISHLQGVVGMMKGGKTSWKTIHGSFTRFRHEPLPAQESSFTLAMRRQAGTVGFSVDGRQVAEMPAVSNDGRGLGLSLVPFWTSRSAANIVVESISVTEDPPTGEEGNTAP
jgi:hypothetical protein